MKRELTVITISLLAFLICVYFIQTSTYTYEGLKIVIEHPRGSIRSGVDRKGKEWETKMVHHYGYIKNTKGADGEKLDVYLGPNLDSEFIFIVTQLNPLTGEFDEYKIMIGFNTEEEAKAGYLVHFPENWKGYGGIRKIKRTELKGWVENFGGKNGKICS